MVWFGQQVGRRQEEAAKLGNCALCHQLRRQCIVSLAPSSRSDLKILKTLKFSIKIREFFLLLGRRIWKL
jgi:hypothetical protein